ncbi:MAG TPA: hypothetical protein VN256_26945 [Pyrinomonadaceae bacterium]|nr:hypothetical protein [Pyrinomonadaceae bacterium]
MNTIYVLPEDELGEGLYRRICLLTKEARGGWDTIGAALGLAGGTLSIALGALLWLVVSLLAPGGLRSFLNVLETAFFALPIPLLALASYCLDLLERRLLAPPPQKESRPAGFEGCRRFRPRLPHQN